ncbi:MAG: hypothetical protein U5K29_12515 [Acidimicrobiales bacterium]|nr:hypothetical protein [Acidimicrobiales bacterium]
MNDAAPVLASELVPWWFAAAFWLALAALVAMAVRDVRRMGGPRTVLSRVRRAAQRRAVGDAPEAGATTADEGHSSGTDDRAD